MILSLRSGQSTINPRWSRKQLLRRRNHLDQAAHQIVESVSHQDPGDVTRAAEMTEPIAVLQSFSTSLFKHAIELRGGTCLNKIALAAWIALGVFVCE